MTRFVPIVIDCVSRRGTPPSRRRDDLAVPPSTFVIARSDATKQPRGECALFSEVASRDGNERRRRAAVPPCHCEERRDEATSWRVRTVQGGCFVASLLAMTTERVP